MTRTVLVTAAGTDIGKTFVTAGIARRLVARGHAVDVAKPIMSGFDPADLAASDAGLLLAATGRVPTKTAIESISPWRFAAPLSPDMAAEREGRTIDFEALAAFCAAAAERAAGKKYLLIEGVGGVMAPVGERHTMLDLAERLAHPVLLVAGTYLGAISHALTALAALRTRGLPILQLVLNDIGENPVPPEETARTLARFAAGLPITIIPRGRSRAEPALASLAAALSRR